MKRLFALLLTLSLFSAALPALAETQACIIPLQGDGYRVKLREKPGGRVIGQYFSDVMLTVLADEGKWSHVRIGSREGWMMSEFLAPADDDTWHWEGNPGSAIFPDETGAAPLCDAPNDGAAEIARAQYVHVLGTIGEDWLHVFIPEEDDSKTYGYARSTEIGQTDNFATAVVDTGDAAQRVNVREAPSSGAQKLGEYWSGVTVRRLYDDHVADDGWERVRIGSVVGYIKQDFLDYSSAGCPLYRPPLALLTDAETPLYAAAKGSETLGVVTSAEAVSILGVFGNRYQVRVQTEEPYQYRYGMIDKSAVKHVPQRSAITEAILLRDVPVLYQNYETKAFFQAEYTIPAGSRVRIYRTCAADGSYLSEYAPEGAVWFYVESEILLPDGSSSRTSSFVPADALRADKGMWE